MSAKSTDEILALFPGYYPGRSGTFQLGTEVCKDCVIDVENNNVYALQDTRDGNHCSAKLLAKHGKKYSWQCCAGYADYNLIEWTDGGVCLNTEALLLL